MRSNQNDANTIKTSRSISMEKKAAQNERTTKGSIDLLKQYMTNEMFSALFHAYETPHFILKLFLVIFLLIAYALAAYTTIDLIMSYLDFGVSTTTRTLYEVPAIFPKITFCNQNMFTTRYAYEFLQNHTSIVKDIDIRFLELLNYIFERNLFGALIETETEFIRKKFSHEFSDVLLSCKFNYEECGAENFTTEFDPYYGNCYSFNTDQLRKSNFEGSVFGLTIELYLNFYEKLSHYNSILGGLGAIVRIENISYPQDFSLDGLSIPTGYNTFVALSREFKSILPKPYSNCEIERNETSFSSELFNLIQKSPYVYTQNFCLVQCMQRLIIQTCNCFVNVFKSVINSTVCLSNESLTCVYQKAFKNVYLKNDFVQRVCMPECPLECYTAKFSNELSSYKLIGDTYVKLLNENPRISEDFLFRNMTKFEAKESVAKINVFYGQLSFKISEEKPIWSLISVIASIGGNLGLFLGVSLFSLCEIFTAAIECVYFMKNKNSVNG